MNKSFYVMIFTGFILFVGDAYSKAVEADISICLPIWHDIKKLDPFDIQEEKWKEDKTLLEPWKACMKKLAKNGLTVAECISSVLLWKEKEAYEAVLKEWNVIEDERKQFEAILQKRKEKDALLQPSVVFTGIVPCIEVQELIRKKIQAYTITAPVIVYIEENMKAAARVRRLVDSMDNTFYMKDFNILELHQLSKTITSSVQLQRWGAVIEHELAHIILGHTIQKGLMREAAITYKKIDPEKSPAFRILMKIHEKQADRISQVVCSDMNIVREIAGYYMGERDHQTRQGVDYTTKDPHSVHATDFKRAVWALRIYYLRDIEAKMDAFSKVSTQDSTKTV